VFSARVAAVKNHPVLHHCVVIFFSGSAHARWGVSGVASFIATDEQLQ